METEIRKFGWIPDHPDYRDRPFKLAAPVALPPKIDLSNKCTPVYNQGALGSCTANAIAAAIDFALLKQGKKPISPSRLFIYYQERFIENTVSVDAGAMIRTGIKSVNKDGACPESIWPYDVWKFAQKPSQGAYIEAQKTKIVEYQRLDNRNLFELKQCLASGFPFVFGFSVYDAFVSPTVATTGRLNMPTPSERMKGGHAVLCVGYSDSTKRFIVRNSWGNAWGKGGYYSMPYEYLTNSNLADDFWKINLV